MKPACWRRSQPGLALLALITPLVGAESPGARVGWLLAFAAAIEMLHGLRRATARARRQAAASALISLLIAFPLINASFVSLPSLRLLVALFFAVDVVRYAIEAIRQKSSGRGRLAAAAAMGNAAVLLLVVLPRAWVSAWVVALAGAARIAGIAWNVATARIYDTSDADQTITANWPPRRPRSDGDCGRGGSGRNGACADRSRLDVCVHSDPLRDSYRTNDDRAHPAQHGLSRDCRGGRHADCGADLASADYAFLRALSHARALDRAARLGWYLRAEPHRRLRWLARATENRTCAGASRLRSA